MLFLHSQYLFSALYFELANLFKNKLIVFWFCFQRKTATSLIK